MLEQLAAPIAQMPRLAPGMAQPYAALLLERRRGQATFVPSSPFAPKADPGDAADSAVWAISCFFVRTKARGKGLSHRLVAAGIDFATRSGARWLEACPIDQSRDSRSIGLFVGSTRVFEKAGFSEVAVRKPGRPLMRIELAGV